MTQYECIKKILDEWSEELSLPEQVVKMQQAKLIKLIKNEGEKKCIAKNVEKKFPTIL